MKSRNIFAVFGLLCSSYTYAGAMGPAAVSPAVSTPYASLEVSSTWLQSDGLIYNNRSPGTTSQPWGGRFAVGILKPYSERLSFTGEFGGGYYGSKTINIPAINRFFRSSIDAYDLLAGALYKINKFDAIGQIGVLMQNHRWRITQDYALQAPGGLLSGVTTKRSNLTQILPELRVGGMYNYNDNLGVSLVYMHAFGSTEKGSITSTGSPGSLTLNGTSNFQGPTLNSILLGVRYYIT
jgi:hypothetical protein